MASASESKIEMITVEMKSEDVQQAIIAAARKEAEGLHHYGSIDTAWKPQVISNNYGGFVVYFRKADPRASAGARLEAAAAYLRCY